MSYPTTLHLIGGKGGSKFSFTGEKNGASLEKIWVWVGGWQVKAVRAWLSDGREETFGNPDGSHQEYIFSPGECFTLLSLWGNGAGTRLGAIQFKTNKGGQFFASMTNWALKTQYPIDVGSGYCLGIVGSSGSDIDNMGFLFLNPVESAVLLDVGYPTINQLIPKVEVEEIKSATYKNDTSTTQQERFQTSKKVTKTSSWSMIKSFTTTFSVSVKAGIPEIADSSTGFRVMVGAESTYKVEQTEEKTETVSTSVEVPPKKNVEVKVTIGRVSFDLPYTGTMKILCKNASVLRYDIKGKYKGVTYTDIKVTTTESNL